MEKDGNVDDKDCGFGGLLDFASSVHPNIFLLVFIYLFVCCSVLLGAVRGVMRQTASM